MFNFFKKIYNRSFLGKNKLTNLIDQELKDDWTILDVGCGKCSPLEKINRKVYKTGLDFYKPYIEESSKKHIHDNYIIGDVRELPFKDKSFNCAISIEVIEHLKKDDGLKMIKEMERVAKDKIILTTPNGFLPTYAGPNDNPEESHISGWTCEELEKLGFQVYGFNGLKFLWTIKNGKAIIKGDLRPPWSAFLVDLTQLIAYNHPQKAYQLIFIKEIKK